MKIYDAESAKIIARLNGQDVLSRAELDQLFADAWATTQQREQDLFYGKEGESK